MWKKSKRDLKKVMLSGPLRLDRFNFVANAFWGLISHWEDRYYSKEYKNVEREYVIWNLFKVPEIYIELLSNPSPIKS